MGIIMSKGLEALKNLDERFGSGKYGWGFNIKKQIETIEKELKALEIIKKKGIDTIVFNNLHDYDEYLEYCESSETFKNLFEYTKEEFDSLKEELK